MGKLEKKILGTILLVVTLGAAFALSIVDYLQRENIYGTTEHDLLITSDAIATAIETAMLGEDKRLAQDIAINLERVHDVESIAVLDAEGKIAFKDLPVVVEPELVLRFGDKIEPYSRLEDDRLILFEPLVNDETCAGCHNKEQPIVGAIKLEVDMGPKQARVLTLTIFNVSCTIFAVLALTFILWLLVRNIIIKPVKKIEEASMRLAEGDMSFEFDVSSKDEIGVAGRALKRSVLAMSKIIGRVRGVARQISDFATDVETDSREMVEGTNMEARAIEGIAASIRELHMAVASVSDSTESLHESSESSSAAVDQMSVNVTRLAENSGDLFQAVEISSSSIRELTPSFRGVAERTGELLHSTEATLETLTGVTQTIGEIDEQTAESAQLSDEVRRRAARGGLESMARTMEGMRRIEGSVRLAADQIAELEKRSEEIGLILTVIDEITSRTSLLALNAAILAARVGEEGKGFTVVAQEVKDLAQKTSASTHEIGELIARVRADVAAASAGMKQGMEDVYEGRKLTSEAAEVLDRIVAAAEGSSIASGAIQRNASKLAGAAEFLFRSMVQVRDMVHDIDVTTSRQSQEMVQLERVTEQVREIATQVRNAAKEQREQGQLLRRGTEIVFQRSVQIARSIKEQEQAIADIDHSAASIAELPLRNRNSSRRINDSLKRLVRETDVIVREMELFRLIAEDETHD